MKEKKKYKLSRYIERLVPVCSLTPYLTLFTIFFIVPFVFGIIISFCNWNMYQTSEIEFVGFKNYLTILMDETSIYHQYFVEGIGRTFLFVLISVPFLIILPLVLAILIDIEPPGYKIFRVILFMPTVLSISAVVLIWKWQFYNNGGFINAVLAKFGIDEIPFLLAQPWAWIAIVIVTVWWTSGTNMVILGAGLKNVDKAMYEAASLDGASYFQTLLHITMPALSSQLFIVCITTVIGSFNIYGQPDLLTAGGPDQTTTVLMMYIRRLSVGMNSNPGIATAMSVMLGLVMIVISIVQAKVINKMGSEG